MYIITQNAFFSEFKTFDLILTSKHSIITLLWNIVINWLQIILAIIALVSPLYAQSEEKVIEKRGIYSGIGLGYAGHGGGN